MNDPLEIITLGGLDIRIGGEPVTGFESRKVEALLVYLACTGRPQSRDVLADLLWDDLSQTRAMANLRGAIYDLRQHVGPYLEITRHTAALNPDSHMWLDVAELERILGDVTEQGGLISSAAVEQTEQALELYRGEFLAGFHVRACRGFEEWMRVEQERLRGLVVETLHELMAHHLDNGAYKTALAHARRLLELDPWSEAGHRGVMVCLASTGQRAAALAQYKVCRVLLEQELHAEPEAETVALYEKILIGEIAPPAEPVAVPRHNLPVSDTPFVGRQAVLEEINKLLEDPACRLLTLVGPGGSGKTRLALAAAAAQLEHHAHGVSFVSLAPLIAVESIVPAIADALDFRFYEGGDPEQQLLDYLRAKNLLLVIDNYEHLLPGAGLVTNIIRTAPDVKVLATSRERLNVGGEQRYQISGMLYPETGAVALGLDVVENYSAVKLFLQGARRARSDFEPTHAVIQDIVHICRLVEGMPLAIRLAAAWVDTLTPAEIATEIAHGLDVLETERRDVPGRQRSVRAAFDHSWRLLTQREQEVFQGLSVFRGGFTRDAARAVAGASLHELKSLVNKSLLQLGPSARYETHELLRQYGEQKLDGALDGGGEVRNRHCSFFAAAVERWGRDFKGARQREALVEMRADRENAHAAWEWAVRNRRLARLKQMVESLGIFYWRCSTFHEGETLYRRTAGALAASGSGAGPNAAQDAAEAVRLTVQILSWQGWYCAVMGQHESAEAHLAQALALLEDPVLVSTDTRAERAFACYALAVVAECNADFDNLGLSAKQSAALFRSLGETFWLSCALMGLVGVASRSGDHREAQRLATECLAFRRELGDRWGTANVLARMGATAADLGELDESERLLREAIRIHELTGFRGVESGFSYLYLGETLARLGRFSEAYASFREASIRFRDSGAFLAFVSSRLQLGWTAQNLGDYEGARGHAREVCEHSQHTGLRWHCACSLAMLGSISLAEGVCPDKMLFLESRVVFQEPGDSYWAGYACSLLGYVARELGQLPEAREHLNKALQFAVESGAFHPLITSLPALALLLADEGDAQRAVELYALASRYPYVANSRWFEDVAGKQIATVVATLAPDVVAAAQERGRARDLWETAAELLEELERPGWSGPGQKP